MRTRWWSFDSTSKTDRKLVVVVALWWVDLCCVGGCGILLTPFEPGLISWKWSEEKTMFALSSLSDFEEWKKLINGNAIYACSRNCWHLLSGNLIKFQKSINACARADINSGIRDLIWILWACINLKLKDRSFLIYQNPPNMGHYRSYNTWAKKIS